VISPDQIIELLDMKPLPAEGGYYVETYRSGEIIGKGALPARYASEKHFGTAILYLLTPETFSALHRVKSDEIFHFYMGDAVTMLQLHPDGSSEVIALGHDILQGQVVQATVAEGVWQGCFLNKGGEFALMGTTVAPGFDFEDFEAGERAELLERYPGRKEMILRLTRQ